MTTTTEDKVEVRRTFPVSRERIFAAWTDPEEMKQWFGGDHCRASGITVDFRVGGSYSVTGCRESETWNLAGVYREIIPPSRLVYTWQWLDDPDWEGGPSLVTVEFTEVADGTEVSVTHERFPTEESRGNHDQGWTQALGKLSGYLGGEVNHSSTN